MARFGPKLEKEQVILGNFVDIGVGLFVMGSALSYADHLMARNPSDDSPQELADLFCREARKRIEDRFEAVRNNHNRVYNKVAGLFMDGRLGWLADGSTNPIPPAYRDWEKNDYAHPAKGSGTAEERAEKPRTTDTQAAA